MASTNAVTGPANNHQYLAQLESVQRPQVKVPASSVRSTADSFTSSFKQKISGIDNPKTVYTITSRYDQISKNLNAGAATQPSRSGQSPTESEFSASTAPALASEIATLDGTKIAGATGTNDADTADDGQAEQPFTMDDLRAARDLIGTREGDENFDTRYDVNEDGEITFSDLVGMLSRFGPSSEQGPDQGADSQ